MIRRWFDKRERNLRLTHRLILFPFSSDSKHLVIIVRWRYGSFHYLLGTLCRPICFTRHWGICVPPRVNSSILFTPNITIQSLESHSLGIKYSLILNSPRLLDSLNNPNNEGQNKMYFYLTSFVFTKARFHKNILDTKMIFRKMGNESTKYENPPKSGEKWWNVRCPILHQKGCNKVPSVIDCNSCHRF